MNAVVLQLNHHEVIEFDSLIELAGLVVGADQTQVLCVSNEDVSLGSEREWKRTSHRHSAVRVRCSIGCRAAFTHKRAGVDWAYGCCTVSEEIRMISKSCIPSHIVGQ